MKLASLLRPELIRCGLTSSVKHDALVEMVRMLVAVEPEITEAELLQALSDREKLGPFSMGKGVAFPHARTEKVKDFTIVLATSRNGVDFRAPDGHHIRVSILFVIPKKHSNLYLHALAAFLNIFAVEDNLRRIVEARTPQEVLALMDTLGSRPREGGAEVPPVATIGGGATLRKAIETLAAAKTGVVPVVDGEGNLVGQLSDAGILRLGANGGTPQEGKVRQSLQALMETTIESIPGLVESNGYPTVQEGEPWVDRLLAMPWSGPRCAYVLRGRRLLGAVSPADLLKKVVAKG